MLKAYVTALPTLSEENFDAYALIGRSMLTSVRKQAERIRDAHGVLAERILICVLEQPNGVNCVQMYISNVPLDHLEGDWFIHKLVVGSVGHFLRKASRSAVPLKEFYRAYYCSPRWLAGLVVDTRSNPKEEALWEVDYNDPCWTIPKDLCA